MLPIEAISRCRQRADSPELAEGQPVGRCRRLSEGPNGWPERSEGRAPSGPRPPSSRSSTPLARFRCLSEGPAERCGCVASALGDWPAGLAHRVAQAFSNIIRVAQAFPFDVAQGPELAEGQPVRPRRCSFPLSLRERGMKGVRAAAAGLCMADLLLTIAIIAILAAILFPVFARAREKARSATCVGNLVNIGLALRTYAADNDMAYPPRDNDLKPLWPVYWSHSREAAYFSCPSISSKGIRMGAMPGDEPEEVWEPPPPPPAPRSLMEGPPPPPPPDPTSMETTPAPPGRLPGGAEIVFCQPPPPPPAPGQEMPPSEMPPGPMMGPPPGGPPQPDPDDPSATCYFYVSGYRYDQFTRRMPISGDLGPDRHHGRGNVLFTDGSAKSWTPADYRRAGLDRYVWMDGD